MRWFWFALVLGCSEPSQPPAPSQPKSPVVAPSVAASEPATRIPQLRWSEQREPAKSPVAEPEDDALKATRALLEGVVRDHARDPNNPWAVSHAILALGLDIKLTNGKNAPGWLFESYGELTPVGEENGIRFPAKRGKIRIEPHTDLILKALTESGARPEMPVSVGGKSLSLADLYRHSVARTWTDERSVSVGSWNDTPWTLQALATWADGDFEWVASGHQMSMDAFTSNVVAKLADETRFMHQAMENGVPFQKKGQGIFGYTCGGAHLFQGAAYAVARGFGTPEDREQVTKEINVLFWRFDIELDIVDAALQRHPDYALVLLEQRLKFIGHFIETAHKLAALELYVPTDQQRTTLAKARAELVKTVGVLSAMGVFERLPELSSSNEQMYLDFIGDSAHALRGIDLSSGEGAVHY